MAEEKELDREQSLKVAQSLVDGCDTVTELVGLVRSASNAIAIERREYYALTDIVICGAQVIDLSMRKLEELLPNSHPQAYLRPMLRREVDEREELTKTARAVNIAMSGVNRALSEVRGD